MTKDSGSQTDLWMAIRDIKQPWMGGPGQTGFQESPQGWSIGQGWGARKHKSKLKKGVQQGGNQEWKELRECTHLPYEEVGTSWLMEEARGRC